MGCLGFIFIQILIFKLCLFPWSYSYCFILLSSKKLISEWWWFSDTIRCFRFCLSKTLLSSFKNFDLHAWISHMNWIQCEFSTQTYRIHWSNPAFLSLLSPDPFSRFSNRYSVCSILYFKASFKAYISFNKTLSSFIHFAANDTA